MADHTMLFLEAVIKQAPCVIIVEVRKRNHIDCIKIKPGDFGISKPDIGITRVA